MIVKESDLYRIISAITMPSTTMAPIRTYCMNCKEESTVTQQHTSMSKLLPSALVTTTIQSSSPPHDTAATTNMIHCRHCCRSVCTNCCKVRFPLDYFGKNFRIDTSVSSSSLSSNGMFQKQQQEPSSWPCCVICEKILASRREIMSHGTQPTTTTSYGSINGINDFLLESYDDQDATDRYSC